MFGWLKSLFGIEQKIAQSVTEELKNEQEVAQQVVETPDFESMTKLEIDIFARDNLGLKLDRRKKKEFMIEQVENKLKEK